MPDDGTYKFPPTTETSTRDVDLETELLHTYVGGEVQIFNQGRKFTGTVEGFALATTNLTLLLRDEDNQLVGMTFWARFPQVRNGVLCLQWNQGSVRIELPAVPAAGKVYEPIDWRAPARRSAA